MSYHLPSQYNAVYIILLMSGVAFLLPYNTFVTAVDFFQDIFPGSTIIFDISLVYILTALIAVLLNNVIIETFSLKSRIMFGYLLSLLVLLTFLLLVWLPVLNTDQAYGLVLLLVATLSMGATGEADLLPLSLSLNLRSQYFSPAVFILRSDGAVACQIHSGCHDGRK